MHDTFRFGVFYILFFLFSYYVFEFMLPRLSIWMRGIYFYTVWLALIWVKWFVSAFCVRLDLQFHPSPSFPFVVFRFDKAWTMVSASSLRRLFELFYNTNFLSSLKITNPSFSNQGSSPLWMHTYPILKSKILLVREKTLFKLRMIFEKLKFKALTLLR